MKTKRFVVLVITVLWVVLSSASFASDFPDAEWKRKSTEKAGLNLTVLAQMDSLMKKAKANGVLIYKGYLIAEWNYGGAPDKTFEVQSITKTITSTVLGLALKDGLISGLDAKVKDYYPAFEVGPYTDEITFRHLITASSGIRSTITKGRYYDPGDMKPGIESRYHNDHTHHLAAALTYMYCKDLGDVMKERILQPIQAQDEMRWGHHRTAVVACRCGGGNEKEVKVVGGYAFSNWTARDLARVGYLYLHDGKWEKKQLLPIKYTKEARMPISIPVMSMSPNASPEQQSNAEYGLAWRGRVYKEDGRILWYMSGNGGQFCVVMPEHNLVMTKINSYKETPFTEIGQFESLLWHLVSK